jgi:acyl carrier protein
MGFVPQPILRALIEEQLGCVIEDDEINAEVFETFGSLVGFILNKQYSTPNH